jgi:hypothetical protein
MSDELTRRCGVCGEERPAAAIDVRRRHVLVDDGREHVQHDINFCRDRPACVEAARFDALFDEGPPTPTEVEAADRGLVALRDLGDGRELAVEVIGGSQGRLTVGRRVRLSYVADVDYPTITQAWDALEDWPLVGDDAFDYPTVAQAWDALEAWDGRGDAPVGWTRRLSLDRHREGGDR